MQHHLSKLIQTKLLITIVKWILNSYRIILFKLSLIIRTLIARIYAND